MQFIGLGIGFAILALVVLLFATRVLLAGSWLLGWLRGMFGLTLLGIAVARFSCLRYQYLPTNPK